MGRISEVYYEKIDPSIYSPEQIAECTFYQNLVNMDDRFNDDYSKSLLEQIEARDLMLRNAYNNEKEIPRHPLTSTTILTLSLLGEKTIIVTEY